MTRKPPKSRPKKRKPKSTRPIPPRPSFLDELVTKAAAVIGRAKTATASIKATGAPDVFTATASTGDLDRANDRVDPRGWKLDRFRANPVLLFSHRHDQPPVGKAEAIWTDGRALRARLRFVPASIYPFAAQVAAMIRSGFLNSLSVGFRPLKQTKNAEGGYDISAAELLELSIVPLPALPQATIDRTTAARVQKWLGDDVVLHLRDDDDDRVVLRIVNDQPRRNRR